MLVLEDQFRAAGSSFVVISGRRRSGKTTVLMQFMRRHPNSLYFLARKESSSRNLVYFRRAAADFLGRDLGPASDGDWNRTFREIVSRTGGQKMVIMMDEFQNIGQKDPTFPAVIQYIWDTVLKGAHVMLVISGSSIPQMSAQVLEYGSPLYGRRTAQIMLGQLSFSKCSELYGAKSAWDQVMFYSVTGGVPKYVKTFGGYRDVYSAVEGTVLNPDSYLYDEVMASLQSEVTDIGSYASILGSIASGHRKLQDMADDLGLKQTGLTNYLKVLMDTGLVERDVPVTDDDPFRSKKGLYRIADRMTAFWFRYVYPHSDLLGRGEKEKIMNIVRSDLPFDTMRSAYVEICTEKAWDMASEGSWGLIPDRIGGYWGKDVSADIVGIDYGAEAILVGTCVCSESPAGPEVLEDLKDVGGRLMSVTGAGRVEYVVFSISGFEGEWPDDVDLVEGV
ncbi:ATP-binding protein [Methanomethylophilus alvi]|uniref:ATP-binding protein n=1 Tax=Methanomethylophilus alvi TaxID=1291540 RepID=UPI0037DD952C